MSVQAQNSYGVTEIQIVRNGQIFQTFTIGEGEGNWDIFNRDEAEMLLGELQLGVESVRESCKKK